MIKVFAVCGMGLGTSTILKSRLKQALDSQGVEYSLDVTDASAASGQQADIIFTSDELSQKIRNKNAKIVVIDNSTDRKEIARKAEAAVAELEG